MNTTAKQTTPLVTYETVAQACQALDAESKRPSVRAIIAYLGGGSPNLVLDYQRQWKAGRPVIKAEEIQVDPRIGQIVAEQIGQAVAKARADIEAQLTEAEQDAETVGKAGREAEERAKTLDAELEAAKGQIQALTGQIDQLKADAEQVKTTAAEQVKAAEDRAAADVAKAEEEASRERQAREAAQVALAKAELRLEALPRLEAEIERIRAELFEANDALHKARGETFEQQKFAAVAQARFEGAEQAHADTREQLHAAQAQVKEARDALVRATDQLAFAQNARAEESTKTAARIGTLEGTVATLEKQLAAAATTEAKSEAKPKTKAPARKPGAE